MRMTKYSHSCIRLEDEKHRLVLDPGSFSEVDEALDGVDTVLITHLHVDHIDVARLAAAASANPALRIWGPADLADQLSGNPAFEGRVTRVGANESFEAGGLSVRTFGGQHALVHSSIPIVSNVGFLIADAVYHPGDSFAVPNATVEVALIPLHAPWSKTAEVIDYAVAVRAPRAFQIHDALLAPPGRTMAVNQVSAVAANYGTAFTALEPAQTIDL